MSYLKTFINRLRHEPVVVFGAIATVVAFTGYQINEEDIDKASDVITVLAPVIASIFARRKVTPINDYTELDADDHPGNPYPAPKPGDDG